MKAALYLFDDAIARGWEPFSLTRPAGELLFGTSRLRERAEAYWGIPCSGHLGRPELEGFEEEGAPSVGPGVEPPADRPLVVVSSRAVVEADPAGGTADGGADLLERLKDGSGVPRATLTLEGRTIGWVLPPGASLPPAAALERPEEVEPPDAGPEERLAGTFLERPWELVSRNEDRLRRDLEQWRRILPSGGWRRVAPDTPLPPGVQRIGEHPLFLGPGAELEPGCVVDLREGPVALGAGARVRSFALLEGPAYAGPDTILLGGVLSTFSAGPVCRLRGELTDSIVLGYANKAHDGHLGHAYLGAWVNLGAQTTNSDLKNNYGNVRVHTPWGEEDTGLTKVGCFMGDHAKTAIGTLIGTGAVVGAGSNVFGGAPVGRYLPPFSWGGGASPGVYDLDRFLQTARTVMARRGIDLSPGTENLLRRSWERTAGRRGGAA